MLRAETKETGSSMLNKRLAKHLAIDTGIMGVTALQGTRAFLRTVR